PRLCGALAPARIPTLSLHDALPICDALGIGQRRDPDPPVAGTRPPWAARVPRLLGRLGGAQPLELLFHPPSRRAGAPAPRPRPRDRKSTRLNSSHVKSSYAVFCSKK